MSTARGAPRPTRGLHRPATRRSPVFAPIATATMSALALVRGVERHRPLVPFAYASHGDALRVAIEVALSLPLSERFTASGWRLVAS